MIGRHWRRLRYWLHDRFGIHRGVFTAKYGRVCPVCRLPVRWDGAKYVVKRPLELHPPIGVSRRRR